MFGFSLFVIDELPRLFLTHLCFYQVEDYYKIVEEPMDFGTMRAKLHEGLYTNFEQFKVSSFLEV